VRGACLKPRNELPDGVDGPTEEDESSHAQGEGFFDVKPLPIESAR
jgi:hypothetical protein